VQRLAITQKTIKILWANAAGRCAFPDCRDKLCTEASDNEDAYTIGEMAHICGKNIGSNRHLTTQSEKERDSYENLILLCPKHHTIIDQPENANKYSVKFLLEIKVAHESYFRGLIPCNSHHSREDVAKYIFPLIEENHSSFTNYGPHSEAAKRNPESAAHSIWLSERLSTIIPNNRKILEIVTSCKSLFKPEEQEILATFILHAKSYEKWVQDDLPYEAVVRFPLKFKSIISEIVSASA
jgi:hypothetical protein